MRNYVNMTQNYTIEQEEQECPICFEEKEVCTLLPCHHAFCITCIHHLLHHSVNCPMCRQVFTHSKPVLMSLECNIWFQTVYIKRKDVRQKYGLGIIQTTNGVKISSVDFKSNAYNIGLQKGNYIRAINMIPCFKKECVIQILEQLTEARLEIECDEVFI